MDVKKRKIDCRDGLIKSKKIIKGPLLSEDFIPIANDKNSNDLKSMLVTNNLNDLINKKYQPIEVKKPSKIDDGLINHIETINPPVNSKSNSKLVNKSSSPKKSSKNTLIQTKKLIKSSKSAKLIDEKPTIQTSSNEIIVDNSDQNCSEDSIDLNDLKGYHDFNKTDLDSSSSSYYRITDDDSDDETNFGFDKQHGCVEMNINLLKSKSKYQI